MNPAGQRKLGIVAAIGFGIGGVVGLAGTSLSSASLRQELWALNGVEEGRTGAVRELDAGLSRVPHGDAR